MSNQSYYNEPSGSSSSYPPEKHIYDPPSEKTPFASAGMDPVTSLRPSGDPEIPEQPPPPYQEKGMAQDPHMGDRKSADPDEDERGLGATVGGGAVGGALGHHSGHTASGAAVGAVGANVAEHFMHNNHNNHDQNQNQQQEQQYPPGGAAYGQMGPGPGQMGPGPGQMGPGPGQMGPGPGYGPPPPGMYGGPPPGAYGMGPQPLYGKYAYKAQKKEMKMERKQMKHGPRY